MNRPDYDGAVEYAFNRMAKELAPELQYHGIMHTFDHVLPAAMRLAAQYKLEQAESELLRVAAAFHDIGWICNGAEHEKTGVKIIREVLPSFGFRNDQIERIAGIIMVTKPPQKPHDLLGEIMVDADLDVLGREDFWLRNHDLREELASHGQQMSDEEWCLNQLEFLQSHCYFTDAAKMLREEGKQKHIEELKQQLQESSQPAAVNND